MSGAYYKETIMNTATNMVTVKSTVKAQVSLNVPSLNLRRSWPKKGAIQKIPFDALEQAIYEPGVEYLFKSGTLYIEEMEIKIALGLEDPESTAPENIIVLNDAEMKKLLTGTALKDFRETVEKLSHEQLKELIRYAIEIRVTDFQRCSILSKAYGGNVDVLKAVMQATADQAKDAAEAEANN